MPSAFPTEPSPDWGYVISTDPRIDVTQYGDGYSQRIGDGLNTMLRSTTLTFTEKTDAEKEVLRLFLEAANGVTSFTWAGDDDPDEETLWYAPKWTITPVAAHLWTITVDLKEDPVP